jgi:hypothetical protein
MASTSDAWAHGPERPEEQREDEEERQRHDHAQPRHRALLVLELPAPGDAVARRHRHRLRHLLLRLGDEAALVAAAQVGLHRHVAPARLARDARRALAHLDCGDIAERNGRLAADGASGQRDLQSGNVVDRVAVVAHEAHGDVEAPVAVVEGIDGQAGERGLHHGVDLAHVQAQARDLLPVDGDGELGLTADAERGDVGRTADTLQHRDDALREVIEDVEVGSEDLHHDLALRARERASSTLSWITCEKFVGTPGMARIFSDMSATRSSFDLKRHWPRGFRSASTSRLFGPLGSVPSSGRPT